LAIEESHISQRANIIRFINLARLKQWVIRNEDFGEVKMKWLEIIKLRSAGKDSGLLEELLLSVGKSSHSGLRKMKTYHHVALELDLSVHLHWESVRPEQNGSPLGLHLAQALKEFGLIDHSVWIEEES
jgi:hypothetical protein